MPTNLRDFLEHLGPQETWVIPYRNGCNRVPIQIPAGITCEDVRNCIDCEFILGILSFSWGLIVDAQACRIWIDLDYINANIISTFDCVSWYLTVWGTIMDLTCLSALRQFSFTDGSSSQVVLNLDAVTLNGRDGLGFWLWNWGLNISLPNPRLPGQVLTWNGLTNQAYRANPIDICCDQIIDCMQPIIDSLQHQISIIAGQLCPCWTGEWAYNLVVRSLYNFDWVDPCVLAPLPTLIRSQVMNLNFQCVDINWDPMCSSCFYASYDTVADDGIVDVNLNLNLARSGCQWYNPYILSLCGTEVDLTCLAQAPLTTVRGVDEDWDPYTIDTVNMNFGDCFILSNSSVPGGVRIDLNEDSFNRGGCDDGDPNQYILSLCGTELDLSCLATNIAVKQTVFVMKNGDDSTGIVERFDKPFLTVQAAIDAAAVTWVNMNVIVYTGDYLEVVSLKNNVDVYFHKGTTVRRIQSFANNVVSKVTGHVNISPVRDSGLWFWTAIYIKDRFCEIEVNVDKIYLESDGEQFALIVNGWMRSKLRARVGSIEARATVTWVVTMMYCGEEFASMDVVTWVFNTPPPKLRFYRCTRKWELYRHDSSVIQASTSNVVAYENQADSAANVYIKDVFIRGQRYGSGMSTGWFTSVWASIVNVNNLIMDLYPKTSLWSKSIIFATQDSSSTINFYGMNQVRGNTSWDRCTTSCLLYTSDAADE